MTKITLPWRLLFIDDYEFQTSLTGEETLVLKNLARDKHALEIGSAYGYASCIMAQVARSVLAVDPFDLSPTFPYPISKIVEARSHLKLEKTLQIVIGLSQFVLPVLHQTGYRCDLIFIDGDHRYDGVLSDLNLAKSLIHENGTIAIHDVGESSCLDVARALDDWLPLQPTPTLRTQTDTLVTLTWRQF